jgi:chemotaxis protein methyltransferase CheR
LLTPEELKRVCQLLYLRTGMTFDEQKRYYIERRIKDRVQKLGLNSVASYLRMIFVQPAEMEALINAFTINETYFYREESQLTALGRSLLPLVVSKRRPGELVRIWSLPCASGEEPYSIAIWLLENWPLVDAWHIEIVGSDIDTDARRGLAPVATGNARWRNCLRTSANDIFVRRAASNATGRSSTTSKNPCSSPRST